MPSTSEEPRPVEVRRVARIPLGLIVALVVLRLCTGWHFYREGTKKLSYNPETGQVELSFSAEGMLRKAVGPLAATIRSELPNFHSWESELAKPWQIRSLSEKEEQELQAWEADYAARQKQAKEKGEAPLFEFSPRLSYSQWANHVVKDWQATVDAVKAIPGMSEAQQKAAQAAMDARRSQLTDYLAGEATAIAEWQHELYRLDQWESAAGATGIPFEIDRIKEKRSETAAASAPWIAEVRSIQSGLYHDLRALQNAEQAGDAATRSQYDAVLADAEDVQLHRLNLAVTGLIIGVGVCLVLGLFTRLAALGGALFLISVIATQPPWVPGAMTDVFYYQLVEIAGLAVLFASSAGRWAGLDFFLHALFGRCCGRKESV